MYQAQYKFLAKLCSLYDGEHFVPESKIRENWKKCPSHDAILNIGEGRYFVSSCDLKNPSYIPTLEAVELIRNRRNGIAVLVFTIASLAVGIATLVTSFF